MVLAVLCRSVGGLNRPLVPPLRGFARGAECAETNIFSIAVDLPSLKLWQGKEDGDGKLLSS